MEAISNSSVVIDAEKLENSLKYNLEHQRTFHNTIANRESTICEVQSYIRKIYKDNYEPAVLSIGPCHHGKPGLRFMEKKKWGILDCILRKNRRKNLGDYIEALGKVYERARNYYPEEINIERGALLKMLLLDGCFVLVALYGIELSFVDQKLIAEADFDEQIDPHTQDFFIMHDILLAENQIPFFVLKIIYDLFTGEDTMSMSLENKIAGFIEDILGPYPKAIKESNRPREFRHLLHLCHIYLSPSQNISSQNMKVYPNHWHRAVRYRVAGIELRKRTFDENRPHSLLDVRFNDGLLEIPYFSVDEQMTFLFRNLIAFEHTSPQLGSSIAAYAIFMSELMNNPKDVTLLVNEGIIEHHFRSDEEVSKTFSELGECVSIDVTRRNYLTKICQSLDEYYQAHIKSWKGLLRCKSYAVRNWI